jgi:hypothetical protein
LCGHSRGGEQVAVPAQALHRDGLGFAW